MKYENGKKENKLQPMRHEQINYISKWQSKGDYYLSQENLIKLDSQLLTSIKGWKTNEKINEKNVNNEKKENLHTELSSTYFARNHNIIREEYEYEKNIIEERIKTWSVKRLQSEGFTLLNLNIHLKGNLYQEQVYRFSSSTYEKLGYHRFGVGDSVKVTLSRGGDPLSESAIDGVVLQRNQKYLDVCIRTSDTYLLDKKLNYRLDTIVNRITFDRMINALQLFLQPAASSGTTSLISKSLRDVILYSYPNSMIQVYLNIFSVDNH